MELKIICSKCKSDNVLLRYWYNPNTNKNMGWDEDEECYCCNCKTMTLWEEVKAPEKLYNIKNKLSGRNIGYVIEHNGQEYLADITYRSDLDNTEFAIFKSKDGQFTIDDAKPLFRKENVRLSYEDLEKCIDEFIKQL